MDQGDHLPKKAKNDGQFVLLTKTESRGFVTKLSHQKKFLPDGGNAVNSPTSHTACECKRSREYLQTSDIIFSELSPEGLQVSSTWPLRFRFFRGFSPSTLKRYGMIPGFPLSVRTEKCAHAESFHLSILLHHAWPDCLNHTGACPS